MKHSNGPLIDPRGVSQLRERFAELSASYVPEWRFDPESPDAGTALALIFINQMADNIGRLNRLYGKYHTEFANLVGVNLLPAVPARGIAVLQLASDTVEGVALASGAKLLGQGKNGESIIFETLSDIYVTGARLRDLVAISPRLGKIIPIMNGPQPARLLSVTASSGEEAPLEEISYSPAPFSPFDFDNDGIEKNAVLIYHSSILRAGQGMSIRIKALSKDGKNLAEDFANPEEYELLLYSENGFVTPDSVSLEDGALSLSHKDESKFLDDGGYVLCIEKKTAPQDDIILSEVRLCTLCGETPPAFVMHNSDEQLVDKFLPFGETAALYDECYIGDDRLFSQQGADINLSFHLSSQQKLVTFTPKQEEAELKVIKRKPRAILFDTADTCPEKVSFEYYNGIGWKNLSLKSELSSLFDGSFEGTFNIDFVCPDDWQPITNGGFSARMLRMRILQADNCYLQPCIHTMPVITDLRIKCSYEGEWKLPQRLETICGTIKRNLTDKVLSRKDFPAFSPLPYGCDAVYMGLDEKPKGAPVSFLFDMAESVLPNTSPLTLEYSTISGFKPLKAIDGTRGLARSGTVLVLPPNDFAAFPVEGVSRFWLRLTDTSGPSPKRSRFRPLIKRLLMNAVDIINRETLPEEDFFIDVSSPNMVFPLAAKNVYKAKVYVSEMPLHSPAAMEQMARQMPDRVRIVYDFLGNITSFFVLWDEVESFDVSRPGDRHYIIDRAESSVIFGDGVHVMIPPAQSGAAFTVSALCCDGQAGNLPAEAVSSVFEGGLFLGEVYNPIATYGGSDLESVMSAQNRAASIVCGRNCLVSEVDFIREIHSYSDAIEKVACISGLDIWGRQSPGTITIAVMLCDYSDGAHSFAGLHDGLKARLLSRCEATVSPEDMNLCEPSYVRVSVDIWIQVENASHSFEAQNLILDSIRDFLDPLAREGREGWEMGVLPTDTQLRQMLHSLRFEGRITKFIVTARYIDESGAHETDLDHLPKNPFSIAINGEHRVFMELDNH